MTTDLRNLKWREPENPRFFDFNGKEADLDNGLVIVLDYIVDKGQTELTIYNPETGWYASSADTQDWPILDSKFGRWGWHECARIHEGESRRLLMECE